MSTLSRTNAAAVAAQTRLYTDAHALGLSDVYVELTPESILIQNEENTMTQTQTQTSQVQVDCENYMGAIKRDLDAVEYAPTYDVGETVLDLLDFESDRTTLRRSAAKVAFKAIGNTALVRAIYAAQRFCDLQRSKSPDVTLEALEQAEYAVGRWSNLAAMGASEALTYADNAQYDACMTFDYAFQFLTDPDGARVDSNALALIQTSVDMASHLSDDEKKAMVHQVYGDLVEDAKKRRVKLAQEKEDIRALVEHGDSEAMNAELFSAREHLALFDAVHKKLKEKWAANTKNAAKFAGLRDVLVSDNVEIADAINVVDKAIMRFRKRNRDALVDVVMAAA